MAANAPTMEELLALVQTLQGQNAALTAAAAAASAQVAALTAAAAATSAPVAVPAPVAAPAPVAFADTPQTLGANELIDYLSKRGSDIYKQGIAPLDDKALTDGFNMTAGQTVVFTKAFLNPATVMGWNKGSKQITTFTNSSGVAVDIIKSYGSARPR
jgi:hypothetical protein